MPVNLFSVWEGGMKPGPPFLASLLILPHPVFMNLNSYAICSFLLSSRKRFVVGSPKCQQYDNVLGKSFCLRAQFLHLSNETRDPGSAYPREAGLELADEACMPLDIDLELSKMVAKT